MMAPPERQAEFWDGPQILPPGAQAVCHTLLWSVSRTYKYDGISSPGFCHIM